MDRVSCGRECGCMCCSECLARSRVTTEQGYNGDKSTATPRALRDILSHMSYLEGGCEKARTWTPEIRWRCSRGAASNALHSAWLLKGSL